ncbi:RluA family pseudouridine synthase [Lichenibacterium dinghuense]|uniref:RluA family pseudouridine synthase n=1 Tax=Lichenibacterium dinghuense TaxID=2895977 RepID=UPI001F39D64B|nr:RNA pseudouridine synthase [Lichenibacterium sp. 6Y81]
MDLVPRLLYRDALMLVLDKPAGIAVHPGPKGGDSLEAHFDGLRFGLPRVPALAHRLDRETSGCLVLGRHRKALQKLGALFKAGRVDKTYWAVVEGMPAADSGTIDLPLGRRDAARGWWMQVDPAGQEATTDWRVLGRAGGRSWLELKPRTGRTHQIRVHCAALGWPLVGDGIYGDREAAASATLHLLARRIAVPLYPSRAPVEAEAPVPDHMVAALTILGFVGDPARHPGSGSV